MKQIEDRHSLLIEPVKHALSYHLVLPVTYQQQPAILKTTLPNAEFSQEIAVLQASSQDAESPFARCLLVDPEAGWVLLEALQPGTAINQLPEQDAIPIAARLMQRIHQLSPPVGLPHIQTWALAFQRLRQAFDGQTGPFRSDWVEQAEHCFQERGQVNTQDILLHGDLHHQNILQDGTQWRVIDPKGMLGPACFEPAAYLRNHLPDDLSLRLQILSNRITSFSQVLQIESSALLQWGFAQTLLSAVWSWEDQGTDWQNELKTCALFKMLQQRDS